MQVISNLLEDLILRYYNLEDKISIRSGIFENEIFVYKSKGLFKTKVSLVSLKKELYESDADYDKKILSEIENINEEKYMNSSMAYIIFCKSNKHVEAKYYENYLPSGKKLFVSFMVFNEAEKRIYFKYRIDQPLGFSIKKLAKIIDNFYSNN